MPTSQPPKSFFPLPEAPRMPKRRPHALAKVVSTFGVLGVLLLVTAVIAVLRFDINSYKPEIEAAVQRATGRSFAIRGRLAVVSYFTPTISADDVVLANMPGAPQKDMIDIARVEADISLRALLAGRVEIARMVLVAPDVLFEVGRDGQVNWRFPAVGRFAAQHRPASPTDALAPPGPAAQAAPPPPPVAVRTLHIKDGRFSWRDLRTGGHGSVIVKRLSAIESNDVSQIQWVADLQFNTGRLQVTGQTGPLLRLLDPTAKDPWPIYFRASPQGALITVSGSATDPLRAAGYDLQVKADIADPIGLSALAGVPPPPLRGVSFLARLTEGADGNPRLSGASLQIGPSDLGAYVGGLQIDHARFTAAGRDQPVRLDLRGSLDSTPMHLAGSVGSFPQLLARASFPVDLTLDLGDSSVAARGMLGRPGLPGAPELGAGLDLDVSARIRSLSAFDPLLPRPLPPLQDVSFTGHLRAAAGGLANGFTLTDFNLRLPQGDLNGAIALAERGRPYLRARLRGGNLDVDTLLHRLRDYHPLPLGDGPPPAALPFARTVQPVISDDPLDLALLRLGDADITLDLGQLTFVGLQFKDLSATLALKRGTLLAEPVHAQLPGGPVSLRASLDTADPAQPVALRLHAPGLSVRPLLQLLGRPEDITGTLALDVDATAHGHSLHAWAGSATGHLAAAIVDGTIDNALLVPWFAGVLRVARLPPDLLFGPGRARLRCAALRLDSTDGQARLATALVDADRTLVQAEGSLRLGAEIMDLRLRPVLRVGGPGLAVPLFLRGSFRSPVLTLDQADISAADARAMGLLSAGRSLGPRQDVASGESCAAALAVVRGGAAGPVPAAPPSPSVARPYRFVPSK